ncbi:hypothetical protein HT737_30945, partial [Pseudomonas sp. MD195_PC81_125]|uniref:hypothetical protein n=1 Tax=Pseudomonas sp. MD195_PC81_125 TaxID=2741560 RepID=UPI0017D3C674
MKEKLHGEGTQQKQEARINNKKEHATTSWGASAPLVVSVFRQKPPFRPCPMPVACGLQRKSAASYTIPRLNARICAHHAVILWYGRTFLQTVHPMLKKLFQSFRTPVRRTQHIRSTPEVLNSGQHSLQKGQFSRYAVN